MEWWPDLEETKQKIYANKDVLKKQMNQSSLLRGSMGRLKEQAEHAKTMQEGNHDLFLDKVKKNDAGFNR